MIKQQTSPVSWGSGGSAVVGIKLRKPVRSQAGTYRIIIQRCQNNGKQRLTDQLNGSANPIVNIQWSSCCRKSCSRTIQFHNQTFGGAAFQTQPAKRVQIVNDNFVTQHVNNVGVVPDRLRRQKIATNFHSVNGIIFQSIQTHQRTLVVRVAREFLNRARAAARILHKRAGHRVSIDVNHTAEIIPEDIIQNKRLSLAHKNCGRVVSASIVSRAISAAHDTVGIIFNNAVCQTQVSSMQHFNRIKRTRTVRNRS